MASGYAAIFIVAVRRLNVPPLATAAAIVVLYLASLSGFFMMYYGLQWAEYG